MENNNKEFEKDSITARGYSEPSSTISASSLQFVVSSNTNEWYTPARYVEAVRAVFQAEIQLDPASCELANAVVQAKKFYTIADDGLSRTWNAANAFINPPYKKINGASEAGIWLKKLIHEYSAGNVKEAIMLINASTSEKWFQRAYDFPICLTNHRLKFWGQPGNGPTKGSALVYVGSNPGRFASVFEAADIGTVVVRYRPLICTEDVAPKLLYADVSQSSPKSSALDEIPDGCSAGEGTAESD